MSSTTESHAQTATTDETTEPVKLNGLDLASLKPADRKILEKLFGMRLPERGTIKITVKKSTSTGKCQCGACDGEETKSEFKSGHDMRIKSVLKSIVAGEDPKFPNGHQFTKASAAKFLAERGW